MANRIYKKACSVLLTVVMLAQLFAPQLALPVNAESERTGMSVTVDGTTYWSPDFGTMWARAVTEAEEGKTVQVQLLSDWYPNTENGFNYENGTDDGCLYLNDSDIDLTIDLNGHTISRNRQSSTTYGQVFWIGNGSLTITDSVGGGKITGGWSSGDGGGVYVDYGEFHLLGGSVEGNKAENGGGIYCDDEDDAFVYIKGGEVSGNTASENGGGIYVNSGEIHLLGGSITGNTASGDGGGIYMYNGSLYMEDGSITGNTANGYGGGVYWFSNNIFALTGGSITDNTAGVHGGGVYVTNEGPMYVGGTAVVTGNTAGDTTENVYLPDEDINLHHTVGQTEGVPDKPLSEGANIGVSVPEVVHYEVISVVGGGFDENSAQYFSADDQNYFVDGVYDAYNEEYELSVAVDQGGVMEVIAGGETKAFGDFGKGWIYATQKSKEVATTVKLGSDWKTLDGKFYFLNDEGEETGTNEGRLYVSGSLSLTIDLNGHTLSRGLKEAVLNGQVFYLESGKLIITDNSAEKTGKITGGNTAAEEDDDNGYGGAFYVEGGSLTVKGGNISGNKAQNSGGAIYMAGGEFSMTGGSISGNWAGEHGGGLYSYVGNVLRMTGGTFAGNAAGVYGGAIAMDNGSFFLSGGEITGNSAPNGAGIYWEPGMGETLLMTGGSITDNTADVSGGGVYLTDDGSVYVGGTLVVSGNKGLDGRSDNIYLSEQDVGLNHAVEQDGHYAPLTEGAIIGVRSNKVVYQEVFSYEAGGFDVNSAQYFTSDDPAYYVTVEVDTENGDYKLLLDEYHGGYMYVTVEGEEEVRFSDFSRGWAYAVEKSTAKPTTVKLGADWNAPAGKFYCVDENGSEYGSDDGRLHLDDSDIDLTVDLNGYAINRNLSDPEDDGQVFRIEGGKLTIIDTSEEKTGKITGGNSNDDGGAFYIDGLSSFLYIKGGTITGNTAPRGGAIFMYNGSLYLEGGEISGNSAVEGAGIYWDSRNICALTGGIVTDNTASSAGGGLYVTSWGDVYVGGTVVITGNEGDDGRVDNIYLSDSGCDLNHAVGQDGVPNAPFEEGAAIGVRTEEIEHYEVISGEDGGFDADSVKYITSDDTTYFVDSEANTSGGKSNYRLSLAYDRGGVMEVTVDGGETKTFGDFGKGWIYALQTSESTEKHVTVKLGADWKAIDGMFYYVDNSGSETGTSSGYLYVNDDSVNLTIDLNGHTIDRGLESATDDGHVFRIAEGNLTIADGSEEKTGKITGGNNIGNGGAFYMEDGTLNIAGGSITGNKATDEGGMVYVDEGFLYVTGGSISNNEAGSKGGAIYFDTGSFHMSGGSIVNNTATEGGGIYWKSSGVLCLTGGSITGNTASEHGGGVYGTDWGNMYVGGTLVVTDNTGAGNPENFYLPATDVDLNYAAGQSDDNGAVPNVPFAPGANIGVYAEENGDLISNGTSRFEEDCIRYLHSDSSNHYIHSVYEEDEEEHTYQLYFIEKNDDDVKLPLITGVTVIRSGILTGAELDEATKTITLTAVNTKKNSFSSAALESLVNLSYNENVIDVVGYGDLRDMTALQQYRVMSIDNSYTLYDVVVVPEGGEWAAQQDPAEAPYVMTVTSSAGVHGYTNFSEGWVYAVEQSKSAPTTVKLLVDWNALANTGFYCTDADGDEVGTSKGRLYLNDEKIDLTIDLNGHKINRNLSSAADYGQVFWIENGSLTIVDGVGGGKITGGKSSGDGGGICVNFGKLFLDGGSVTGNEAKNGGGIYCNDWSDAFVYIRGGKVSANTASENGGGIYANNGFVYVESGEISGNSAKNGGGIYWASWDFLSMTGGKISDNTASERGGGVYGTDYGNIYVGGTAVVTGNTGGGKAENIYLSDTDVYLNLAAGQDTGVPTAPFKEGANIGVSVSVSEHSLISGASSKFAADCTNYLKADNTDYVLQSVPDDSDQNHPFKVYMRAKSGSEQFVVTFNGGGAAGSMDAVSQLQYTSYTLPACGFTVPENMTFYGWSVGGKSYAPGAKITLNADITVKAVWKFEIPAVAFAASGADSGVLNGLAVGMSYSLDGGESWVEVTDSAMPVSGLVDGGEIRVIYAADGESKLASDAQIISIAQADAPEDIVAVDAACNVDNGAIRNLSDALEYSTDGMNWITVTGDMVTGLAEGTYYVRVKANGAVLASESTAVTVGRKEHRFVKFVDEEGEHLLRKATCTAPAVYAWSCDICGKNHESMTFEYGDPKGHVLVTRVHDRYLVSEATCTSPAVYSKSCAVCSAADETETFTSGNPLEHSMGYAVIEGKLYHACGGCSLKEEAITAVCSGKTVTVTVAEEAELQPTQIYCAVYDTDGRMIAVRVVEWDGAEMPITFDDMTGAAEIRLFFLGGNHLPWLSAIAVDIA